MIRWLSRPLGWVNFCAVEINMQLKFLVKRLNVRHGTVKFWCRQDRIYSTVGWTVTRDNKIVASKLYGFDDIGGCDMEQKQKADGKELRMIVDARRQLRWKGCL